MTAITWRVAASGVTSMPVSGAGTRLGGGGSVGGGSVGGTGEPVGSTATRVGDGTGEGDGPGALVAATAPPGRSVPIWDATRIPRVAIASPIRPTRPRRSVLFWGALDCATVLPLAPPLRARRIADLRADTR